ncbi:MAG: oligopeptide transporter, OPT family, partial [Rhodothermales bacterium]|nr:oligopeptide transporter, OPT family [Rhodothermales bacterium]
MADDLPPSADPDRPGAMMPAGDVAGPDDEAIPAPYVPASESPAEATAKAVVAGILFGILFGAANAYLGLRAGLTISTSIPVAVMTVALFRALQASGVRSSILEANLSQTVGSASSSVASGVIFTLPALFLWGFDTDVLQITLLAMSGGLLGILFMIPLRPYLIVREHPNLPYPEGTACAEVLKASESGGAKAKNVFLGLGIGMLFKGLTGWIRAVPDSLEVSIPFLKKGQLGSDVSAALFGVGYILGPRIATIMVGGGLLSWLVIIPIIAWWGEGRVEPLYPETALTIAEMSPSLIWTRYVRYIGAGAVATGGLITLIRSIPTMIESFRIGAQQIRERIASGDEGAVLRTENDLSLKVVGVGALIIFAVLALMPQAFSSIDLALGRAVAALLVVVFAFFFVTVSSRIVGLVGVTSNPTSGMTIATLLGTASIFLLLGWTDDAGKIAALTVGAVVAIAASIAGDTSQDLKTGFLLGATPRRQQVGELAGVLTSAAFVALTVLLLATAYGFGGEELPAPQAT